MATIEENLQQIAQDVLSIKTNLGLATSASLNQVVEKSAETVIPTGTINITENGIVDVTDYANANVNVSGGGDIDSYFATELATSGSSNNSVGMWISAIKKIKALPLASTTNTCKNLFRTCRATEINTSLMNTANINDMSYMFHSCTYLTSLNVTNFNTSKVTNMSYMFYNCTKLATIDVTHFDTSKVTNMSYMFQNCSNLESIDLSNFDTSKVTSISYMFASCTKLEEVDLSSFNFEGSVNTSYAFSGCTGLKRLIINNATMFPAVNTTFLGTKPPCIIYVPDNMVETYKTDTNWSVYANYIRGMSSLPTT